MPESHAFEHVPQFPDFEQAVVSAEEMLLELHGAGQVRGSVIACRSAADASGRCVEGTLEPYYMYRHEESHLFKVYAAEVGTPDATRSIETRFWLMANYGGSDGQRADIVSHKDHPVTEADKALIAEFLGIATKAYKAHKAAEATRAAQEAAQTAELSPRFHRFTGRVATLIHLKRAA